MGLQISDLMKVDRFGPVFEREFEGQEHIVERGRTFEFGAQVKLVVNLLATLNQVQTRRVYLQPVDRNQHREKFGDGPKSVF
jgi:hypothetical protein